MLGIFSLSSGTMSTTASAKTLFLRVGEQLSTEAPSMNVVTSAESKAVTDLHANSPYFHNDHAHTDYVAKANGGATWSTPPFAVDCELIPGAQHASLWIGTNAKATDFTVSLSHWQKEANEWSSVCGATISTRTLKHEFPGKQMIAIMANGGYSVELPVEMDLVEPVPIRAGDVLRLDVSGSPEASGSLPAAGEEPVVHRIWHAPKWASTVRLGVKAVDGALKLDLPFVKGPKVTQPVP